MLRSCRTLKSSRCAAALLGRRNIATEAKKEGDISSVFVSLSGTRAEPLPRRYADLKGRLINGHHDELRESWERLLVRLEEEILEVEAHGPNIIPQLRFEDIHNAPNRLTDEIRKRGVAVIRGVMPEEEALRYKTDVQQYVKDNPHTKAFPPHDPQVFELYWSPSQVRARAHPNLLKTQRFLMSLWHSQEPDAPISTAHPLNYADRVRIRRPGDTGFALGPHVDGGGVERWEEHGYGLGRVYDKIWQGKWEEYDPWESSCRLPVVADLYNGAGACSMFRMFQGWLSMSDTGPGEGTLLVNPFLSRATAYFLLRPFFSPRRPRSSHSSNSSMDFLRPSNWSLDTHPTTSLQGATPSHCQELNDMLHPHLQLSKSMVHVPRVRPGDYVVWHCDTIHAVDHVHAGTSDASVMYIGTCPLTEANARYLARQRASFLEGIPPPDFPGGKGESDHIGRPDAAYIKDFARRASEGSEGGSGEKVREAEAAMGLAPFMRTHDDAGRPSDAQLRLIETANRILA